MIACAWNVSTYAFSKFTIFMVSSSTAGCSLRTKLWANSCLFIAFVPTTSYENGKYKLEKIRSQKCYFPLADKAANEIDTSVKFNEAQAKASLI